MQRNYTINEGNTEIRVDFGNQRDYTSYALEVISTIDEKGKVSVDKIHYLGCATKWDKDRINMYLMGLYNIDDEEM